jgi:hypothetical protein
VRVLKRLGVMLKNEWHRRQPRPPLIVPDPIGKVIEQLAKEFPEVHFGRQADPMTGDERVMVSVHREDRHEYTAAEAPPQRVPTRPLFMTTQALASSSVSRRHVFIEGKRWASGPFTLSRFFLRDVSFDHLLGTLRREAQEVMQALEADEAEQRRVKRVNPYG